MNVPVFINNNEGQVVLVLCLEDYVCFDRRSGGCRLGPGPR